MSTEEEEITAAGSALSPALPVSPPPEIPIDPIFSTGSITTPAVRNSIGGIGNLNGSRHVRYSQRRLRGEKRTLPMYGEGDDRGKYFRCWNCGFICNIDRDALGDGDGRSYAEFAVETEELYPADNGGPPLAAVMKGINEYHTILERDGYQVGGTGCPLCHTKNWK